MKKNGTKQTARQMDPKKVLVRIMAILLAAAMIAGSGFYLIYIISPSGAVAYGADSDAYTKLDNLKTIIQTIDSNYRDEVDVEALVDAAYDGVFEQLDNWSVYYKTEKEEQQFISSMSNEEYCGVGVTISKDADTGYINVVAVNIKGPAYAAGVKKGDAITHIDGKAVKDMTIDAGAAAIRGKEGSTVKLTILRAGQSMDFTLTRTPLTSTVVNYNMLEGTTIAYIDIDAFNLGTAEDFYLAYQEALADGATSFIIDVRDNPGGYVDEALNTAAVMLKPGSILIYYMNNGEVIDNYYVVGDESLYKKYETVVLINEDSASASEMFAAAMQGNDAAELVGVTTYGKGVVQQIFEMDNGDSFKLSTQYFTGPDKKMIDGVGVKPDYLVYNNAGLTDAEVNEKLSGIVPMTEGKKYVKLNSYGLNVLAAQQRLAILGYDVKSNGILDEATMTALKDVQKKGGVGVYGGLDFTTIKLLDQQFNAYLYGTGDAQLAKAIELLTK